MKRITRRTAIRGVASASAVAFVAGCLGDDDDDNGDDDDRSPEEIAVDWVSAADNVDSEGDIVDETGADSVTIENGHTGDGGNYIFEPGIVRVDSGTEVTWEWVDSGHDLTEISDEGATITDWDDEPDQQSEGHEHSTTFDDSGVALYYCEVHAAQNQRGAVIVE